MQDLMQQAQVQMLDLVAAWKNETVNQKQELAKDCLPWSCIQRGKEVL